MVFLRLVRREAWENERAAPAPRVPLIAEEYERLKREEESGPAPDQTPAQEDRPATRRER